MSQQTTTYIPGVCNINAAEIRKRRNIGYAGLAVLVLLLVFLFWFRAPAMLWASTFFPAFLMITGFLQAKRKFCVGYAAAGMYHVGDTAEKVGDVQAARADKSQARSMNLQVLAGAILVGVLAVVLGAKV